LRERRSEVRVSDNRAELVRNRECALRRARVIRAARALGADHAQDRGALRGDARSGRHLAVMHHHRSIQCESFRAVREQLLAVRNHAAHVERGEEEQPVRRRRELTETRLDTRASGRSGEQQKCNIAHGARTRDANVHRVRRAQRAHARQQARHDRERVGAGAGAQRVLRRVRNARRSVQRAAKRAGFAQTND
jgi:hypothetical protein